jgi:hypothetical protein
MSLPILHLRSGKKPFLWVTYACAPSAVALAQSRSWSELQTLKHNYEMEIFQKNGQCHTGVIDKITPSSLVAVLYGKELANAQLAKHTQEINKDDVLALGSGHNIVYSGRSSWIDVREAKPAHAEWLSVRTIGGEEIKGSVDSISDSELVLNVFGSKRSVPKSQIKTVDYVRQRPMSEDEEYFAQEAPELLPLSPDYWLRAAGLSSKLHVRLYDSSLPEDNSAHPCQ